MISDFDILARLALACLLGGVIGLEREGADRPAGFRTHVLVCSGSALMMLVSIYAFGDLPGPRDPARIAAQVVSGIGFLGAGTIIHEGATVKGLTTAASLWVVAGIGLAAGSAFYFAAVASTLLVFLTLVVFGRIEWFILSHKRLLRLRVTIKEQPGQLGRIGTLFGNYSVTIRNLSLHHIPDTEKVEAHFLLRVPPHVDLCNVIQDLAELEGVYEIEHD